nr:hypothetical protein [Tanacetum cinerariifolium]
MKKLFEQYKGFFKETVLLEETKAQEASVKTKPADVKANEAAEKPKPVKNVKELAEKPKEPTEKAHEAPQNVKPKPAAVKTKEAAEKTKPAENVKEVAEKPKKPAKKAQEAPQYVKPKPIAVKTKEAAEKPKPAENVKEVAEKPKKPAKKAQEAPQYVKPKPIAVKTKEAAEKPMPAENVKEVAEKPKEPAGDDYQDELHDWPRVVEPINMVQPFTPKRVFSSPSKGYVKPIKTVNTPYMCRRIDVTARCKRIEFVLGNSLFAMEGDKYEIVFQFWVVIVNYLRVSSRLSNSNKAFSLLDNQCIIKGTLTEEEKWKSFYDEIKAQFKYEPSSMSLSDFELVFFLIYASDHFYVVVFNIKKPKTMVILDNSDSGYGYASKYKEACDPLKKLFSRPFIPKLKWRTSNNHVDCGVFAMIHMENYVGDAAKNWEFGLCEDSDEQLSMLQRMRYKIATKIMLHQFNAISNKMFDFAFTFETKYIEQARVSMIVDAIKNMNNRDPPKQVKETESANVVVGVNEVVDQVKEKRRRKK